MEDTGQAAMVIEIARIAREAEVAKIEKEYAIRTIDGETYTSRKFERLDKPTPQPGTLNLSTLQGLIDYVRANPDEKFTEGRKAFIVINSPTSVVYGFGAHGPYLQRTYVAQATARVPALTFGSKMQIEAFLIAIRTLFVLDDAVKQIVALLANIDATNAVKLADDGVSQSIAVKRDLRGAVGVTLPPTVHLQPFRTFSEVTQPASPFLLRLHGGDPTRGELPTVSLTEADLGQWVLAATKNVKTFLGDALPDIAILG